MNDQSNGQKLFLTRLRRHRITVLISRVLILTVFLFLWELCARFEIIDSFIFSSPSKITLCFLEMLKNRSLFLHIGDYFIRNIYQLHTRHIAQHPCGNLALV